MNRAALKLEARQTQVLTPRLQYAVKLLQLSSLDYAQELQEAMAKNPFLEPDESAPPARQHDGDWALAASDPARGPTPPETAPSSGDGDAEPAWERDGWLQSPGARERSGDGQASAMEMVAASVDLRQHLCSQANLLPLSPRDHTLVCAVIESLDDDGYLRLGLGEIAALTELRPRPDACETSTALKLVQSFEPLGVGARSVAECLLLQLQRLAPEHRELAECILNEHLERLAQHDTAGIAKLTHRDPDDVEHACRAIRRLDPHPGWRYDRSEIHFATPDVIARKVRGQWVVQLNPAVVPKVRLNHTYAEMFQRHRNGKHAELASHLQEARWAIRNVEQRFSTILSVARAILRRQYRFLDYGAFAMKPMGLREIADELVDAVTRVVEELAPIDRVRASVDAYLEYVARHSRAFVALMRGGIGSDPEVAAVVESVRSRLFDQLSGSPVASLVARDARIETAIRGWIGFVEAASIDWCANPRLPQAELCELMTQVLFQILRLVIPTGAL